MIAARNKVQGEKINPKSLLQLGPLLLINGRKISCYIDLTMMWLLFMAVLPRVPVSS